MENTSKTVLIAEDETAIRMNLAAQFQMRGWQTLEGKNGIEAVALTIRHAPDLVVLDVMMPGLDGFAAFQELQADHRTDHIPVIILSAVNDFQLGAHHCAKSIGVNLGTQPPADFIEKPLDTSSFFRRLEALPN